MPDEQTESWRGGTDGERSYLLRLRQDNDRHGTRVDALHPGGEADLGDPLHAVGSTLVLQPLVHVLAGNPCCGVVHTA